MKREKKEINETTTATPITKHICDKLIWIVV